MSQRNESLFSVNGDENSIISPLWSVPIHQNNIDRNAHTRANLSPSSEGGKAYLEEQAVVSRRDYFRPSAVTPDYLHLGGSFLLFCSPYEFVQNV